ADATRIRAVVTQNLQRITRAPAAISGCTRIARDLHVDSLGTAHLLFLLEEDLHLDVPLVQVVDVVTVDDLVNKLLLLSSRL
ncbi:MAG: phosphopantetheine-binding protein, partial [Salinisphaera sp.]|nr:phosphopantetheine-binding protein [Salinisphaera sp.]